MRNLTNVEMNTIAGGGTEQKGFKDWHVNDPDCTPVFVFYKEDSSSSDVELKEGAQNLFSTSNWDADTKELFIKTLNSTADIFEAAGFEIKYHVPCK